MNRIRILSCLTALIGLMTGCVTIGNGVALQKEIPDIKVDKLDVSGSMRVEVVCNAQRNYCTVSAEENVWPSIEIKRQPDMELRFAGGVSPTQPILVKIETTGDITEVEVEKNGTVKIFGNQSPNFKASLKDSTLLSMEGRGIDKMKCELEDSGSFSYAGRIGNADVKMEDGAKFAADKVVNGKFSMRDGTRARISEAEELKVNMLDGSRLEVGKLNGVISGTARDASEIQYGGDGKVNVNAPGTVKILKIVLPSNQQ